MNQWCRLSSDDVMTTIDNWNLRRTKLCIERSPKNHTYLILQVNLRKTMLPAVNTKTCSWSKMLVNGNGVFIKHIVFPEQKTYFLDTEECKHIDFAVQCKQSAGSQPLCVIICLLAPWKIFPVLGYLQEWHPWSRRKPHCHEPWFASAGKVQLFCSAQKWIKGEPCGSINWAYKKRRSLSSCGSKFAQPQLVETYQLKPVPFKLQKQRLVVFVLTCFCGGEIWHTQASKLLFFGAGPNGIWSMFPFSQGWTHTHTFQCHLWRQDFRNKIVKSWAKSNRPDPGLQPLELVFVERPSFKCKFQPRHVSSATEDQAA